MKFVGYLSDRIIKGLCRDTSSNGNMNVSRRGESRNTGISGLH